MSFQCFYRHIYEIAVLAGVTDPCVPKNFKDAKCLILAIKTALEEGD